MWWVLKLAARWIRNMKQDFTKLKRDKYPMPDYIKQALDQTF